MFTGIIEEIGIIEKLERKNNLITIKIEAKKITQELNISDSIAIDGICLTCVNYYDKKNFTVNVMEQTFKKTTLLSKKIGDKVNLEKALKLNGRLNGHIVTGHISGIGKIVKLIKSNETGKIEILVDKNLSKYIVFEGSIAIDGISLTIGEIKSNIFSIYLIPHTLENTTLLSKKIGEMLNIEVDILAKYLEKLIIK
ncbi:MAG: riboflavin synthase [bacterium]